MISIVNVTEQVSQRPYGVGLQTYEVRINQKKITRFTHLFEDGLVRCLEKAAKAVDDQLLENASEFARLVTEKDK